MKVLTTKEAAEFLRLSVAAVRQMAREGRIPCARVGNKKQPRYRFTSAALENWVTPKVEFIDPVNFKGAFK